MITVSNLHFLAEIAGQRIINYAFEGVLIALLTYAVIRLLPRTNAGTRFAVWLAALFSVVALPLMGASASGWTPPVAAHLTLPTSWAFYALIAWGLAASFGLARVAIGLWHVSRLRRNAREIAVAALDPLCQRTLQEFESRRRVKVCVSDDLRVPAAAGFFCPSVLIPNWAWQELSPAELNTVLMHELGHLRRWDDWTNLLQRILGALLFFHPAVWWINSRLSLEREMACDDLVLAEMADARAYAECLVSISEKSLLQSGVALALAAVSHVRQTTLRLAKILDRNRPRGTRVSRPALAMMTVLSAAALLAAPHIPAIVEFQDNSTPRSQRTQIVQTPSIVPTHYGSQIEPKVILAAAHEDRAAPMAAVLKTVSRNNVSVKSKLRLGRATFKSQRISAAPQVIPVGADEQTVPAMLLVIQTQDYDDAGMRVWSLCVWHLTLVPNRGQPQVRTEAVSKAI